MSLQTIRKAWAGSVSRRCVLLAFASLSITTNSHAQIVTDGSTGVGGPQTLTGPDFSITESMGSRPLKDGQPGPNLFHSFSDFNINTGQSATFTSNFAGTTDNIISRVTGMNPSNINGKLAVDKTTLPRANLWLMNPNGVTFGAGASLDLPAALYVTTADYLTLGEGGRFDSKMNLASTILTAAQPVAFGFVGSKIGKIKVANTTLKHRGITLIGRGDKITNQEGVTLNFAKLNYADFLSEYDTKIVSVAGQGEFNLSTNDFSSLKFSDMSLTNSLLYGGKITVYADDLSVISDSRVGNQITGSSTIKLYIGSLNLSSSALEVWRGSIDISAPGPTPAFSKSVTVDKNSLIYATGGGWEFTGESVIKITAQTLNIYGKVSTSDYSFMFSAGDITLNFEEANVTGKILADTSLDGGRTGSITMNGNSLTLSGSVTEPLPDSLYPPPFDNVKEPRSGSVSARALNSAANNGGGIVINVDELKMSGGNILTEGQSVIDSSVGNDIAITTDRLEMKNKSVISASQFSKAGGSIYIKSTNGVLLDDSTISNVAQGQLPTGIGQRPPPENQGQILFDVGNLTVRNFSQILSEATGGVNSGSITISGLGAETTDHTSFITIGNESKISSKSSGVEVGDEFFEGQVGNAGDINVSADTLNIQVGGGIDSSGENLANAGSITVDADTITLGGYLTTSSLWVGKAGEITVTGNSLTAEGGTIKSSAEGSGDGGSVSLTLGQLTLSGGAEIAAESKGTRAGNIVIDVDVLDMDEKSYLSAESVSAGGSIFVTAKDSIELDEAFIRASIFGLSADSTAQIKLDTPMFMLLNGSSISAETYAGADSGTISISGAGNADNDRAQLVKVGAGSTISTSAKGASSTGDAGDITLYAETLDLDGAITSTSEGSGDAGRITVDAGQIQLNGDITTASSGSGEAGSVTVKGGSLTGSGIISSDASGSGNSGTVAFAMDELAFSGPGAGITVSSSSGKAGDITLDVNALRVDSGAVILAETTGELGSGTIAISGLAAGGTDRAHFVEVGANSSISTSSTGTGNAGNISVYAEEMDLDGTIASTSEGAGDAGTITVDAGETQLDGAITTAALNVNKAGTAGDVTVTGGTLAGSGTISSDARGSGEGGSVSVTLDQVIFSGKDAGITVTSNTGKAGDISLDVNELQMDSGAVISAESTNSQAGSILIEADNSIQLDASRISASTAAPSVGTGGNAAAQIKLDTSRLTLRNESEIAAETTGALDSGNIIISGTADTDDSTDRVQLVAIAAGSTISTSATGPDSSGTAGNISLYAEELALDGTIASTSEGSGNAGTIIVDAGQTQLNGAITTAALNPDEAGIAGDVTITGGTLTGSGIISSDARGSGDGGTVSLTLDQVTFSGKDAGITVTSNTGTAGDITVDVYSLLMDSGAVISAESTNAAAGSIRITAREGMQLDDSDITATTRATSAAGAITTLAVGDSDTAEIRLNTPELLLLNSSTIAAETTGVLDSGSIIISGTGDADDSTDRVQLVDVAAGSTISTSATGENSSGNAGNISLYVEELDLDGTIASSSDGSGNAGDINLIAGNSNITGTVSTSSKGKGNGGSIGLGGETLFLGSPGIISSSAESTGAAGNIVITVDQAKLSGGEISVASNEGTAGLIDLYVTTLLMDQGALISAESKNSTGGSVHIAATDLIQLTDSTIKASAEGTATGDGGGNIRIDGAPDYLILDRSLISANANAGAGGNIEINTDTLIKSADSYITATSKSSINGTITLDVINSLTQNVVEVDAPDLALPDPLDRRCTPAEVQTRSSLRIELVAPGSVESVYLDNERHTEEQLGLAMVNCS